MSRAPSQPLPRPGCEPSQLGRQRQQSLPAGQQESAGVRARVSLHRVSTALGVPGHSEVARASGSPCAPALVPTSPPSPAGASTLPDPGLLSNRNTGRSARPRAMVGKARGSWPAVRAEGAGQRAAGALPKSQWAMGSVTGPQGSVGFSGRPLLCSLVSGQQLALSTPAEGAWEPTASDWVG